MRSFRTVIMEPIRMTNYLFDMGHREIAYVGTLLATGSITDRYLGYMKSLMEHGVAVREDWMIPDRDIQTGKIDMDRLLQLPKGDADGFCVQL